MKKSTRESLGLFLVAAIAVGALTFALARTNAKEDPIYRGIIAQGEYNKQLYAHMKKILTSFPDTVHAEDTAISLEARIEILERRLDSLITNKKGVKK